MKRGDIVYDKADPRHLGRIICVSHGSYGSWASVRWLETNWQSFRIPLSDLRYSKEKS